MTQIYKKSSELKSPEIEEIEEPEAQESKESEADELLGDLNPRYFEEAYSLDEAKQKIYASKGYTSNFKLI